MEQLDGCIRFWEAKLKTDTYLIAPATEVLIKETVMFLQELKTRKEQDKHKLF